MAFWGVEVKPGRPFTHAASGARGRLHISQATLGVGTPTNKSLLQCNVGTKSPVLLCSLFPNKFESCQLNLEFDEVDEVVFSVIGPRSVHITGYYLGSAGRSNLLKDDDSESYGEDIDNTESEAFDNNDDEYEYDSFIDDDDDPEIFPDSPVSEGEIVKDTVGKRKSRNKKRLRRLVKKHKSDDQFFSGSDTDMALWDGENEENLPCSSTRKDTCLAIGVSFGMEMTDIEANGGTGIGKNTLGEKVNAASAIESVRDASIQPSAKMSSENDATPRKKKKVQAKEAKCLDIAHTHHDVLKHDDELQEEEKSKEACLERNVTNEGCENGKIMKKKKKETKGEVAFDISGVSHGNDMQLEAEHEVLQDFEKSGNRCDEMIVENGGCENGIMMKMKHTRQVKDEKASEINGGNCGDDILLEEEDGSLVQDLTERHELVKNQAADEETKGNSGLGNEDGDKLKKKRKQRGEEKILEDDSCKKDKIRQYCVKSGSVTRDLPMRNEQNQKQAVDRSFDNYVDQFVDESHPDERKKKRKNKQGKTEHVKDAINAENPILPMVEKNNSVVDAENRRADDKPCQFSILPNGLITEELETGKEDGKVAGPGKTVSIRYVGKLKENGEVFSSNISKAAFKFQLGAEDVIEGWNVGINGMRVGEKRQLTVPPTLGYGSEGVAGIVPPDSWLVFEVELVKVR